MILCYFVIYVVLSIMLLCVTYVVCLSLYCLCQPFCIFRALPEVLQLCMSDLPTHARGVQLLPTPHLPPAPLHLAYLSCGYFLDIPYLFTWLCHHADWHY